MAAFYGQANTVSLLLSMNAQFTLNNAGLHFIDHIITQAHKECALAVIAHDR